MRLYIKPARETIAWEGAGESSIKRGVHPQSKEIK